MKHVKTRSFFGEEHCYVIDAKTFGNCGRFLNVSDAMGRDGMGCDVLCCHVMRCDVM